MDSPNGRGSIALPVVVTAVALAAFNFGLALLIVAAMGVTTFAPLWVGVVALIVGAACGLLAFRLWRLHLRSD